MATAGLPSAMPVFCNCGHRLNAFSTVMFDCADMSGSLKPSRYFDPVFLACARLAVVTLPAPQIIGTKPMPDGVLIPECVVAQV